MYPIYKRYLRKVKYIYELMKKTTKTKKTALDTSSILIIILTTSTLLTSNTLFWYFNNFNNYYALCWLALGLLSWLKGEARKWLIALIRRDISHFQACIKESYHPFSPFSTFSTLSHCHLRHVDITLPLKEKDSTDKRESICSEHCIDRWSILNH